MANLTIQSTLLARFEFPPYVVTPINERHVIVTGGGGSSKTGVGNRLEIYSLGPGERQTRCVSKEETGDEALMNGIYFNHDKKCYFIGGGMKGTCTIFQLTQRLDSPEDEKDQPQATNSTHVYSNGFKNGDSSVRFRGKINGHNNVENSTKSPGAGDVKGLVTFKLKPVKSFQCDFHPKGDNESFLKCVKYVSSRSLIVTGGSDGHIRTWSFPSLKKLLDIQGPSDEIFDMDVSCDGKLLGTVTRDGLSQLMDLMTGATVDKIHFDPPSSKSPVKYKFKFFRFHPSQESSSTFFTVFVPVVLKTPSPSYIIRWNAKAKCVDNFSPLRIPNVSCLSISQSGCSLAYGTAGGSVVILDSTSLSNLYTIREAHGNIVTRIEFLPSSPETRALSGGYEESVISISIDNKAVWHSFTPQNVFALLSSKSAFIFFLFIVYLITVFISYIVRGE